MTVSQYRRGSGRALALAAAALVCAGSTALAQHTARVAQVQIAPSDAKVAVGATTPFVATAYDAAGNPVTDATFTWSSGSPEVASIDQSGIATGKSPGLAIITVRTGTGSAAKSAQVPIEVSAPAPVVPPPPARVDVTPTDASLVVGAHVRFVATATDSAGKPYPGAAFTWSSSNEAVATVDATGTATGVAPGLAIVNVRVGTDAAGRSAEAPLHVTAPPPPVVVALPSPTAAQPPAGAAAAPATPAAQPRRAVGTPVAAGAVDSLRKACDGNEGRACAMLGTAYAQGRGVTQDYGQAVSLYQKGCDLSAPRSCTALGLLYQRGLGVQADSARARTLFQRACQLRDRQGCMLLRRGGAAQKPN